jgi:hypothetical protein
LRRLGVIQIDKQELDKKLQEMKFSKWYYHQVI